MQIKSTISAKKLYRETLKGLRLETDNTMYIKELFWMASSKEHQMVFPRVISNTQCTLTR